MLHLALLHVATNRPMENFPSEVRAMERAGDRARRATGRAGDGGTAWDGSAAGDGPPRVARAGVPILLRGQG
jgi:hypothetical protein